MPFPLQRMCLCFVRQRCVACTGSHASVYDQALRLCRSRCQPALAACYTVGRTAPPQWDEQHLSIMLPVRDVAGRLRR
jgi:hypothetical protein